MIDLTNKKYHNFIGFELDEDCYKQAATRIGKHIEESEEIL